MQAEGEFDRLMGYRVLSAIDGKSEVELDVRSSLKQRFGLLHGGAIATLVDFCMGSALYSVVEGRVVTAQMSINYIAPATEGKVKGHGIVRKHGGKMSFVECTIEKENEDPIATGTGLYYKIIP